MPLPAKVRDVVGIPEQVGDVLQRVRFIEFVDVVAEQVDQFFQPPIRPKGPAAEADQVRRIEPQDLDVEFPGAVERRDAAVLLEAVESVIGDGTRVQ